MALSVTLILIFQLVGVAGVRALGLPVPGPVLGMMLLLVGMLASARLADAVRPAGQGILTHLSLLFVPAGVGVVGHLATLGGQGLAIAAALLGSTVIAMGAGALVFVALARLTGARDDD
ncbi:MAG: CidA/LrgA family protein [Gemmobacter sp.]|jgi:holin-like protein|nr:CidA/LrgA family protein [Gemmobacter sp.]